METIPNPDPGVTIYGTSDKKTGSSEWIHTEFSSEVSLVGNGWMHLIPLEETLAGHTACCEAQ